MSVDIDIVKNEDEIEKYKSEIEKTRKSKYRKTLEKLVLAALGSSPWVGGYLAAVASLKVDENNSKREEL